MFIYRLYKIIFFILLLFALKINAAPPPWIDIPYDNYETLSPLSNQSLDTLNILVRNYHNISKTSLEKMSERIHALSLISDHLDKKIESEKNKVFKKFLIHINDITKNKKWYLSELKKNFDNNNFDYEYLREYHTDLSGLSSTHKPLYLCNKRMYDSLNGQYWGEYWIETIDPVHRQLTTFHDLWKKEKVNKPNLPLFFLWLEEQNLSKDVLYLNFMNELELAKQTVFVKDGLLYFNVSGRNELVDFCDKSHEYIFNVDLKGNLIVVPASKTIHHVSMSHGKPLLGCGNMLICKGVIKAIELESGHYLPSIENGLQILKIFKEKNIPLNPATLFTYYHNHEKHKSTIVEFLEKFNSTVSHE